MIYCHYWIVSFFYSLFFFIPVSTSYGQKSDLSGPGKLFMLVNNKVDSFLENDFVLMNAKYFVVKHPKSEGNPYFETTNNSPCRLVLGNKEYNNVDLIYDILEQKLSIMLKRASSKDLILELNKQEVKEFYLDGKTFVNSSELPLLPQWVFYEEIYSGRNLKVYARWSKKIIYSTTSEHIINYSSQKRKLFFEINENKIDGSSKSVFVKEFAENRKKIKSFMRKNKIQLSSSNNVELIKLFEYADSIMK